MFFESFTRSPEFTVVHTIDCFTIIFAYGFFSCYIYLNVHFHKAIPIMSAYRTGTKTSERIVDYI